MSSPAAAPITSAAPATAWAGAEPPDPVSRPNGCVSRSDSKITVSTTAKAMKYQSNQGRRRRPRMNDRIAATRAGPAAVADAIMGSAPPGRARPPARPRAAPGARPPRRRNRGRGWP